MKKIFTILMLLFAILMGGMQMSAYEPSTRHSKSSSSRQSAVISNAYLEHNKYLDGNKVMYVRYNLDTYGLEGKKVRVEVSLYKKNGKPLYQNNGKKEKQDLMLNPAYEHTVYTNNWAWFSYGHMKLPSGRTNCYAVIKVYNASTGKLLKTSQKLDFYVDRN